MSDDYGKTQDTVFGRQAGKGVGWCVEKVGDILENLKESPVICFVEGCPNTIVVVQKILDNLEQLEKDVKSFKRTYDYDPILASQECGESGCIGLIGDWQDDIGGFYKYTASGYVAVCKECCGPLTGER